MSVKILKKEDVQAGKEPRLQVSKWLEMPILLDLQEMERCLHLFSSLYLFKTGKVGSIDELELTRFSFLEHYEKYISALKKGLLPDDAVFRSQFALALTSTLEIMYGIDCGNERFILRPERPVIQMQMHAFHYSSFDHKFRSGVLGPESITWGITFSYPQIYQDPFTHQIQKIAESSEFPNTGLFKLLQKFIRVETIPTPFGIGEQTINTPMRLGKECFPWINNHPQLLKKGLKIDV